MLYANIQVAYSNEVKLLEPDIKSASTLAVSADSNTLTSSHNADSCSATFAPSHTVRNVFLGKRVCLSLDIAVFNVSRVSAILYAARTKSRVS